MPQGVHMNVNEDESGVYFWGNWRLIKKGSQVMSDLIRIVTGGVKIYFLY